MPTRKEYVAPPKADDRLEFSPPRKEYVLGEPVLFDLRLHNRSKAPINVLEVFVESHRSEARLWIAAKGDIFQEFQKFSVAEKRDRRGLMLEPNKSLHYQYRVLVQMEPQFHMAFPKPGEYQVYAVYPLSLSGGPQGVLIASSVVTVHITEPVGEDAKVWAKLNKRDFLIFIQADRELTEEHKAIVPKLAEVLAAHPKSSYTPALRRALSKVSPRRHGSLSFEETVRLEEILGLKGFVRPEEDPKDK
ncbi:MAG: hypothetical protein EXS16_00605 [Gemmataceae bacterium]|nr:hypothetical protein [Gemmataceae bacterium]